MAMKKDTMKFLILIYKNIGRNLLPFAAHGNGHDGTWCSLVTLSGRYWPSSTMRRKKRARISKPLSPNAGRAPSRMPYRYAEVLKDGAKRKDHPNDIEPTDSMTWQFLRGHAGQGEPGLSHRMFGPGLRSRQAVDDDGRSGQSAERTTGRVPGKRQAAKRYPQRHHHRAII